MLAVRIERQYLVAHASGCYDFPVPDGKLVQQRIGIDEIVAVAFGNLGRLAAKNRRDIRILTVEVQNVSGEVALLQKVRAASQVIHPWLSLLCPGIVPVEPLAVGSQS